MSEHAAVDPDTNDTTMSANTLHQAFSNCHRAHTAHNHKEKKAMICSYVFGVLSLLLPISFLVLCLELWGIDNTWLFLGAMTLSGAGFVLSFYLGFKESQKNFVVFSGVCDELRGDIVDDLKKHYTIDNVELNVGNNALASSRRFNAEVFLTKEVSVDWMAVYDENDDRMYFCAPYDSKLLPSNFAK